MSTAMKYQTYLGSNAKCHLFVIILIYLILWVLHSYDLLLSVQSATTAYKHASTCDWTKC